MIHDSKFLPLWLAFLLGTGAVALGLLTGGETLDQVRLAARYTARVGFPLFIVAYVASSLARLWPGEATRALVRHRRQWGLGFAMTHSIHLAALASYQYVLGEWPQLTTLVGGGGAYVLLYAMAATSNNASMKAMGIWWKRLQTIGIHWLWFIFTFSYFGRLFDPDGLAQGLALFPVCMMALGLRLWAWRKKPVRAAA